MLTRGLSLIVASLLILFPLAALGADSNPPPGSVTLPMEVYDQLKQSSIKPSVTVIDSLRIGGSFKGLPRGTGEKSLPRGTGEKALPPAGGQAKGPFLGPFLGTGEGPSWGQAKALLGDRRRHFLGTGERGPFYPWGQAKGDLLGDRRKFLGKVLGDRRKGTFLRWGEPPRPTGVKLSTLGHEFGDVFIPRRGGTK